MKLSTWHVSYMNRNNTIMELVEGREEAIALARSLMDQGFLIHSVGSMAPDSYEMNTETLKADRPSEIARCRTGIRADAQANEQGRGRRQTSLQDIASRKERS